MHYPRSVLAETLAFALAKCLKFYDKVFYVVGKVLSGKKESVLGVALALALANC